MLRPAACKARWWCPVSSPYTAGLSRQKDFASERPPGVPPPRWLPEARRRQGLARPPKQRFTGNERRNVVRAALAAHGIGQHPAGGNRRSSGGFRAYQLTLLPWRSLRRPSTRSSPTSGISHPPRGQRRGRWRDFHHRATTGQPRAGRPSSSVQKYPGGEWAAGPEGATPPLPRPVSWRCGRFPAGPRGPSGCGRVW